ncbi:hypothetical protein [Microtetraspora malaysiensis]|uniref:hypothetical protein n=1 Tax=Microtetraspora malaysiensis TaxID=161358 RepID=UPI003D932B5C
MRGSAAERSSGAMAPWLSGQDGQVSRVEAPKARTAFSPLHDRAGTDDPSATS